MGKHYIHVNDPQEPHHKGLETTEAEWHTIFMVNAKAIFVCMQRVSRQMSSRATEVASLT